MKSLIFQSLFLFTAHFLLVDCSKFFWCPFTRCDQCREEAPRHQVPRRGFVLCRNQWTATKIIFSPGLTQCSLILVFSIWFVWGWCFQSVWLFYHTSPWFKSTKLELHIMYVLNCEINRILTDNKPVLLCQRISFIPILRQKLPRHLFIIHRFDQLMIFFML